MISIGWYWLIYDGTGSGTGWYFVALGQCRAVLVGTWWISAVVVPGQYMAVLLGTWWDWVSKYRANMPLYSIGPVRLFMINQKVEM